MADLKTLLAEETQLREEAEKHKKESLAMHASAATYESNGYPDQSKLDKATAYSKESQANDLEQRADRKRAEAIALSNEIRDRMRAIEVMQKEIDNMSGGADPVS